MVVDMVGMETCIKIQSFNKIYTVVFLKAGLHLWVGFFIEWTLQSCYIRFFAIPKIRLFNRCILSLNIGNYLIPQSPNPNESAAQGAPQAGIKQELINYKTQTTNYK